MLDEPDRGGKKEGKEKGRTTSISSPTPKKKGRKEGMRAEARSSPFLLSRPPSGGKKKRKKEEKKGGGEGRGCSFL